MTDKSAIITGSSSGIGEAICRKLLTLGYTVYGLGRREQTHIQDKRFHPIVCDITDTARMEEAIKGILGGDDIHLLIHSAGLGRFEPHEELSPLRLKQIIDTNLTAPVILSSLALRSLKKTKGTIISITSIEALKASKFSPLRTLPL
jgi:NAD(P)-dependent dehydrogenase (short-subunit alcohol dehydrogenase family)